MRKPKYATLTASLLVRTDPADRESPDETGAVEEAALQVLPWDRDEAAGFAPRGLTSRQAAAYVGLPFGAFRHHAKDGTFGVPIALARRSVWDKKALDLALDRLSGLTSH